MSQKGEIVAIIFVVSGRLRKRGSVPIVFVFPLPPHPQNPHLMMMISTSHLFQLFLTQMMMILKLTLLLHHIKREKLAILVILLILVEMLVQMSQNSLLILVEMLVQTSKNTSVHAIHSAIERRSNHLSLTLRTDVTMSLPVPRVKTCLLEPTSVQLPVRG